MRSGYNETLSCRLRRKIQMVISFEYAADSSNFWRFESAAERRLTVPAPLGWRYVPPLAESDKI